MHHKAVTFNSWKTQKSELVLLHNKNFNFLEGIGKGKSFQGTHYKFEEFLTTIGSIIKKQYKFHLFINKLTTPW